MQLKLKSQTTTKRKVANVHPGEVLKLDFLEPMAISAYRLAQDTWIPESRLSEILRGRRAITADTAIRLARYFGTSESLWLGLQNDYDIEEAQRSKAKDYARITMRA
jgi:addiction module HigA family antidote